MKSPTPTPGASHRLTILMIVLVVVLAAAFVQRKFRRARSSNSTVSTALSGASATSATDRALQEKGNADIYRMAGQLADLQARERAMDETAWASERKAEQFGMVFDALWDALNQSDDKFEVLAKFNIPTLVVPQFSGAVPVLHGIQEHASVLAATLNPDQWRAVLAKVAADGWAIGQMEFRHIRFSPAATNPRSRFYCAAHLSNSRSNGRAILEGEVVVDWEDNDSTRPVVRAVDASHLTLKTRFGPPAFLPVWQQIIDPPNGSYFIDPLILYDLDNDGLTEIILLASNTLIRRQSDGRFRAEPFLNPDPGLLFTGVIADFNNDKTPDLLVAKFEGLHLFPGNADGAFGPGQLVWQAEPRLKYGQTLACGDVDHDGDLDVWLGQYKAPYERGQMPRPFYDARDGHPSFLLLNNGLAQFKDATLEAGLGAKRARRTYSASFVDLNQDQHLDLLVVSDFAGLDLYANDGRGHFTDVTAAWVASPEAFGMAHTTADFNRDGVLDFLMIGMNSPAADRIHHLQLARPEDRQYLEKLPGVTYGNRLFMGRQGAAGFEQTGLNSGIARTGWSWGACAADFDNNSFPDLYIANGHETKGSVRDYEPEFWMHDLFVGNSTESVLAAAYFGAIGSQTRAQGWSYGGYERNRLFLNWQGTRFIESGHLLGVSLGQDSRNVAADDLDNDGDLDLLVTTFEVWPRSQQVVHIYENQLPTDAHWIGFNLREEGSGISPVGAQIIVRHNGGTTVRQIITGDSYRTQHPNRVHFGLGQLAAVNSVSIRWVNGSSVELTRPAIDQWHTIRPGRVR